MKLVIAFRNFADCAYKWSQDGRSSSWITKLWEWLLPSKVPDVGVRRHQNCIENVHNSTSAMITGASFLRNDLTFLHFCTGNLYQFLRFNIPLKYPYKSSLLNIHDEDPITNHCSHNELRLVLRKTPGYTYFFRTLLYSKYWTHFCVCVCSYMLLRYPRTRHCGRFYSIPNMTALLLSLIIIVFLWAVFFFAAAIQNTFLSRFRNSCNMNVAQCCKLNKRYIWQGEIYVVEQTEILIPFPWTLV